VDKLLTLLPDMYRKQVAAQQLSALEEIRMRVGQPLMLRVNGKEQMLWPCVQNGDLERVIQSACKQSIYAHQETIRQGYLTVEGGHRIGICGTGVVRNGVTSALMLPSSVNIRIARAYPGCASSLRSCFASSVLILGPPGSGKTTLLRDFVRLLSERPQNSVSLVDERGEISATHNGIPQMQIGKRTDVLTGIPKAAAVLMLLRTMNPTWIAVDEITAPEDIQAIVQASYCGVKLVATAHGESISDLQNRPLYRTLMQSAVFSKIVIMKSDKTYSIREWTT